MIMKDLDRYFFQEAWKYAQKSSDDSGTKHGVVIVRGSEIIAYGANQILDGVEKTKERLTKPELYDWIYHAERNALSDAGKKGISVIGAKMYCPWLPCIPCAQEVISSGIEEVVFHKDTNIFADGKEGKADWGQSKALELIGAAKHIDYRFISGKIFDKEANFYLKFRNKDFSP